MKHRILAVVCTVGSLWLASGNAHAAVGSVKVECLGNCNTIQLFQVCNTYLANSRPLAIACDDTAVGASFGTRTCGGGHCRPYGGLVANDRVGDYCNDGPGYDAVVTCTNSTTPLSATAEGVEDEEQKPPTDGAEDAAEDDAPEAEEDEVRKSPRRVRRPVIFR
jgi:hypothetical protein